MRGWLLAGAFFILLYSVPSRADGVDSGWSLSLGCDGFGAAGNGSFSGTKAGATFSTSGTQRCLRTATRFTKLLFSSFTGTAVWGSYWDVANTTYRVLSINTGDVLITQPITATEVQPIFTVNAACPSASTTVNWLFVQWAVAEQTSLSNVYFLGTSVITGTTGAATMTGQWDVNGTQVFSGNYPMALNACSSGQATSTGTGDLSGTLFYTSDAEGVYKSGAGRATFFFRQIAIAPSDLGSKTYSGIQFDSSSGSTNNTAPVQVVSNAGGDTFTVRPYSNVDTGAIDASYTDTISITATNSPRNGMLRGTVTRTGTGAGGPTKIACLASHSVLKGTRVICSGQSPSNANIPYSVSFIAEYEPPTTHGTYVRVPLDTSLGVTQDFFVAKYEMKNVSSVAKSQAAGTPWVAISRDSAISQCQALGTGYDLITNAEWQAVARNVERATDSSGNYLNWSNGSVSGTNALNRGNSDSDPGILLAASSDGDACFGTEEAGCMTNSSADFTQKRTHTLTSGDIVWDLAGNAWEWVKDGNATTQGTDGFLSQEPWSTRGKAKWGPAGTYTGKNSLNYGGLGYGWLNYSAGAVARGGRVGYNQNTGIFSVDLTYVPGGSSGFFSFRCAYHPVVPPAPLVLDVDGNGSEDPLSDGLLVQRYAFGFTGSALTNGAVGAGATRTTAGDIIAYLSALEGEGKLDLDGNGQVEPLTDALLVTRYLFGFVDAALVDGALGSGAMRTTPESVLSFITALTPPAGY